MMILIDKDQSGRVHASNNNGIDVESSQHQEQDTLNETPKATANRQVQQKKLPLSTTEHLNTGHREYWRDLIL